MFCLRLFVVAISFLTFFGSVSYSEAQVNRLSSMTTDYDGDRLGDLILYDPFNHAFVVRQSSNLQTRTEVLGTVGDVPAVGDYDGDGRTDLGVFNRSKGSWSIRQSSTGQVWNSVVGSSGDWPVVGDYSGSGCSDRATYNRKTGLWSIVNCKDGSATRDNLGVYGALPVPADYDCDGITDVAVFHRAAKRWTIRKSSSGSLISYKFGLEGDIPLAGDFDGDGCDQAAVYRPSSNYFFYRSADGKKAIATQWGLIGDRPFIANVDGDKRADYSVVRPGDFNLFVNASRKITYQIPFAGILTGSGLPLTYGLINNFIGIGGTVDINLLNSLPDFFGFNLNPIRSDDISGNVPVPIGNSLAMNRRVLGDYDRDGRADLTFVQAFGEPAMSLWRVQYATGKSRDQLLFSEFSKIAPSDYDGDGRTEVAVTRVAEGGLVEWVSDSGRDQVVVQQYGLDGDRILVGDFDCDGKTDRTVVRKINGFLYWFIKLSAGSEVSSKLFGLENDKIFAADTNGDGCDEMIVAQNVLGGIHWFSLDIKGKTPTQIPWGLVGDEVLTPMDFNGDGYVDYVVVREINGQKIVFIRYNNSKLPPAIIPFGLPGDISMAGEFSGVNKAELAVFRAGSIDQPGLLFINRFNGIVDTIPYYNTAAIMLKPDGRPGVGVNSVDRQCTVTTDFVDGDRKGALWKPFSDNTGRPVFLLPKSYWPLVQSAEIIGRNGQIISGVKNRSCCSNGDRAHYDVLASTFSLAKFNPITVKLNLRGGATECRVVPNATSRWD